MGLIALISIVMCEMSLLMLIVTRLLARIHQHFEGTIQRAVDLGFARKEGTPWAQAVRTCHKLLQLKKPCRPFWIIPESKPPTMPPREQCASRSSNAKSALASSLQAVPSAAAGGCSRSPPPCGNRAAMSGRSWSRPGSPFTAGGRCHPA